MITKVNVTGNKATVVLSGDTDGAAGYDYVISTDRDCITNKDYDSISKNQVSTSTNFKYVQQGTYYAYCHAWKRDENGKKVFSDWSNAYPFVGLTCMWASRRLFLLTSLHISQVGQRDSLAQ